MNVQNALGFFMAAFCLFSMTPPSGWGEQSSAIRWMGETVQSFPDGGAAFTACTVGYMTSQMIPASNGPREEQVMELSKRKWQWMAEKKVDSLAVLFHDDSRFVHMSGTWGKERELEIIETGSIWYKQAEVHDVVVESFGNTVILWNRITLHAVVRENEVSNQFTVTEVYQEEDGIWQLLDLTFSSVRDTHSIEH